MAIGAFALLPPSLEVFLTSRCNLRCSYCSSGALVDGPPRGLSPREVEAGVAAFAGLVAPSRAAAAGGDPAPRRTVGLTGGEPFVEFERLAESVRLIRRRWDWLGIDVVTNGTLLTPSRAAALLDARVSLGVSIDGVRAATDRHRAFRDRPGTSVFDLVLARLRALPAAQRERLSAMTTFSAETVRGMVPGVRFLRELGFKAIVLDLDMYGSWDGRGLAALREGLAALRRYYVAQEPLGGWPHRSGRLFAFSFENKHAAARAFPPTGSLALTVDGLFVPSDALDGAQARRLGCVVGDIARGIDLEALERVYSGLARRLADGGRRSPVLPPVERYYYALARGLDPAAFLESGRRVDDVFGAELGGFARTEAVFSRLARDPSFGDFAHPPRRRAAHELARLRVALTAGAAAAREAVDCLLYSAGAAKTLAIEPGGPAAREPLEGIIAYAALKARRLGKRLRVEAEPSLDGPSDAGIELLRDFGVHCGVAETAAPALVAALLARLGDERVFGLLELDPGAEGLAARARAARGRGLRRLRLRLRGSRGWAKALEGLVREFEGLRRAGRADGLAFEPPAGGPGRPTLLADGRRFVLVRAEWAYAKDGRPWAAADAAGPVPCPDCDRGAARAVYSAPQRLAAAALARLARAGADAAPWSEPCFLA